MSHLHVLHIYPQIYVDLLHGDTQSPFYLYVGATEDYVRRYSQKVQGYDAYHSGDNDGWCTPEFCRKLHKVRRTLDLTYVDGGRACGDAERDTFLTWFHLLDCNMDLVRGADWCSAKKLQWTDRKRYGSSYGPTLRQAYDDWVASGRAAQIDSKRDLYLGWLQLHV
eukprot:COSAG01_NODE_2339_length_7871_cov_114.127123_6_plen_166_part_00